MLILPNDNNIMRILIEDHLSSKLPDDVKCVGFSIDNQFAGGWAWYDYRFDDKGKCISVCFAQIIIDKRMLNKQSLSIFFAYPFITLGVNRLWALIAVDNIKANAFPQKIGAVKEGIARKSLVDGSDANIWSLTNTEFKNNRWFKWAVKAEAQQFNNLIL